MTERWLKLPFNSTAHSSTRNNTLTADKGEQQILISVSVVTSSHSSSFPITGLHTNCTVYSNLVVGLYPEWHINFLVQLSARNDVWVAFRNERKTQRSCRVNNRSFTLGEVNDHLLPNCTPKLLTCQKVFQPFGIRLFQDFSEATSAFRDNTNVRAICAKCLKNAMVTWCWFGKYGQAVATAAGASMFPIPPIMASMSERRFFFKRFRHRALQASSALLALLLNKLQFRFQTDFYWQLSIARVAMCNVSTQVMADDHNV